MPIHDKFFPGSTVSRYLAPGDRSWSGVVYQSGKPVLDSELNLEQGIGDYVRSLLSNRTIPSGFIRGVNRSDARDDYSFDIPSDPGFTANAFHMASRTASVAGFPLVIEYSNTDTAGDNLIQLGTPPVLGGAPPDVKRTDFVFLEVFQALVSTSPAATGTIQVAALPVAGNTITIDGVVLTAVAGVPAVDQFQIGATTTVTANNISTAINLVANSFDTIVTADTGGTDTVTLYAVDRGVTGNAVTLATSNAVALVLSGPTLAGGVDESNKPTQETIYRHGNVLSSSVVAVDDDIEDPDIRTESTKRVQVQYRIRVTGQTEAINYKTEADGFSNTNVLARGTQGAAVAGYPFIPADVTTVSGNSSAVAYGISDPGLWIAGNGSETASTALGTVDGFVYAIPIAFVFRRNDAYIGGAGAGWEPQSNTNGGLTAAHGIFVNPVIGAIGVGESDRPDGRYADAIVADDVLDLRRHVSLSGYDMSTELRYQMQSLLDGQNLTWAIDGADKQELGAGSGDVAVRFLVCNQIGRDDTHGGNNPTSGSTTRGDTIRNFDHVARRFGDQSVVERAVFNLLPTDTVGANAGKYVTQVNGGYLGWAEGDVIHIDLSELNASTLGDFDPAGITYLGPGLGHNASVADFAPSGMVITDIVSIRHDDGHYTVAVSQSVEMGQVIGLGTTHVAITLDPNDQVVNGGDPGTLDYRMVGDAGTDDGSPRRIFVELELTYPLGEGLTDTPNETLSPDAATWPSGPILENDTTQRPLDYEGVLSPRFRDGFRETAVEYIANDGTGVGAGTPIVDSVVSIDTTSLRAPRRAYGSAIQVMGITDTIAAQPHDIDDPTTEYGSSSRLINLDTGGGSPAKTPLSGAGQTLCSISYFAQDPLPNYGGAGGGYQVGVYYRTNSPPTVGVMAGALTTLPDPLTVEPLVMSSDMWTGQTSKGSVELPFPFTSPMDPIAVNDDGTATFPGEWYFAATASISINDFDATSGLLNLHTLVPAVETDSFTFSSTQKDAEFRAFYEISDPTAYRPTVFSQNLSGVVRHKVFMPFLARVTADSVLFRQNEVMLVIVSRFAELDAENTIRFTDANNRTCVAIYRTRNLLIVAGD